MELALTCDVAVIGAGLSGICAAIAAARAGKKVVLAGDRPVLGGNSGTEVRMWTRGAVGAGNLYSEEMGILGELKLRNHQVNSDGNVLYWGEVLLESIYLEPNITLLLNTYISRVEMSHREIIRVSGVQLTTEKEVGIKARYFIDATGDGSISAKAGVPCRMGYESKQEHNESSAPAVSGKRVLGSTIYFYTKKADHPVSFTPPAYAHSMAYIQEFLDRGGRLVDEKQGGSDYWWFEYGGLRNTIYEAEDIALELRKFVMGVWNYIKNSGKFDADCLTLEWIGSIAGKRESRRMVAEYMLTQNDLQNLTDFADGAFYGGWYMDDHPAEGVYSKERNAVQVPVQTYSVPFRSLFSKECDNLLFAGRLIGVTHATLTSTRVMNTCALSGQAAGTLASACADNGLTPVEQVKRIDGVRQKMLRDDVMLPGLKNMDALDLARQASIVASSHLERLENKPAQKRLCLTEPSFVQLAVPAGVSEVRLLADTPRKTRLKGTLHAAPLPSRLSPGELIGRVDCPVEPGQPVTLEMPTHAENRFVTAILEKNDDICFHSAEKAPLGFLMGHQWSMDHMYPLAELRLGSLYEGSQVLNGYHSPYKEPGLWVSRPEEEPSLVLSWPEKRRIRQVELYLEPDLAREKPSSFASYWSPSHMLSRPIPGRPWQLAESIVVWQPAEESGWEEVASVRDNWQRHVVIRMPERVDTDKIRVSFPAPLQGGMPHSAQVFQIRVY